MTDGPPQPFDTRLGRLRRTRQGADKASAWWLHRRAAGELLARLELVARPFAKALDLSADGTVTAVALEKSSGFPELDAAAIAAASNWHFNALLKDGKPVAGKARVPVSFPPG